MKILITAGTVYGRLDDNKLVGNRIRGIWATKFACWLARRGFSVVLLLPDTFDKVALEKTMMETPPVMIVPDKPLPTFDVRYHNGYDSYAEQCYELAPHVDAAVMAAAVVNWIPAEPIKGKMKTEGFKEGDIQHIPFMLAPRVIDRMRKLNGKLTLVGCKMTSGAAPEELFRQAYQTLLKGHCNVVIANDLQRLKEKTLVYPDGNRVPMKSFDHLYDELELLLHDQFYRTEASRPYFENQWGSFFDTACAEFDLLCDTYREKFKKRPEGPYGPDRVFGSVAVRIGRSNAYLVSPREKGSMFDSKEAVIVEEVDREKHVVRTVRGKKATLNAPLLVAVMEKFGVNAVVHHHEEQPGWEARPYAPPGTVRDNDRAVIDQKFNITGHGCVFAPWK